MSGADRLALVVEDHAAVRRGLAGALERAFEGIEVAQASCVAEAREWLLSLRRDPPRQAAFRIALIDLGLPDGSGVELVRQVTDDSPQALPVVATIYDDDLHLFPAIEAGAQGYLLKEQDQETLVRHLRRIDEGLPPLSPSIARRMLAHLRQRSAPLVARAPETALTPRETEVLSCIGRGLRVGETAGVLGLAEQTVAGYVKTLYRKLNISSRAEAALEAARRGLV